MNRFIFLSLLAIGVTIGLTHTAYAEEGVLSDTMTIQKAKVVRTTDSRTEIIPGTETSSMVQTITAEILESPDRGKVVTFKNDYIQLTEGDIFYLRYTHSAIDDIERYTVADPYRANILIILGCIFLFLLCLFGGIQGIRGLASLFGSLVLIFYLLLPGILLGYSPIIVSIGVSSLIIIVGSYITHGFNKTTSAAVLGMIGTVMLTGLLAYYAVYTADLSGYSSEENVYLNFNTNGTINMVGLLFGGIMIGLLGVLYDIAIGQAVAVEELVRAGPQLTRREVYKRAVRIGREHIGALVNTLAIAYVGVALPLLLLIQHSSTVSLGFMLNSELFATEIIRILVGSIGLILCVPITTFITTYLLKGAINLPISGSHHH